MNLKPRKSKLFLKRNICPDRTRENDAKFQSEINNRFLVLHVDKDTTEVMISYLTIVIKESIGKIQKKLPTESKHSKVTLGIMKSTNMQISRVRF